MAQNARARVRLTTSTVRGKKYDRFEVVYWDLKTTERKRKSFNDKDAAERWAKQYNQDLKRQEKNTEILHRRIGEQAKALSPDVLRDAVDALSILDGRGTLTEAARKYVEIWENNQKNIPTVQELFNEYISESQIAELRETSIKHINFRSSKLLSIFGNKRIDEVTRLDIQDLLSKIRRKNGKRYSSQSIKHFVSVWSGLFSFAIERGYIENNPAKRVARSRRNAPLSQSDPDIYTPQETKAILESAQMYCPEMIAALAIGLFAGVRITELRRLDWGHIDLERDMIAITSDIAKKRSVRNVDIGTNLKKWLNVSPVKSGPVAPQSEWSWRKNRDKVLKHAKGVNKWKVNGMRHSFGSYHLEKTRSPIETALQMGHTDGGGMLFEHYRQLTDRQTAEEYWNIVPTD